MGRHFAPARGGWGLLRLLGVFGGLTRVPILAGDGLLLAGGHFLVRSLFRGVRFGLGGLRMDIGGLVVLRTDLSLVEGDHLLVGRRDGVSLACLRLSRRGRILFRLFICAHTVVVVA